MKTKSVQAQWMRVDEAETYSALSKTELFRACVLGDIESVHMIKPGKVKGIRLINRQSLDAYVRSYLPGGSRYVAAKHLRVKEVA